MHLGMVLKRLHSEDINIKVKKYTGGSMIHSLFSPGEEEVLCKELHFTAEGCAE